MELFLVSVVVLLLSVVAILAKFNKTNKKLPPGPAGIPLVGYLPFLGNPPHVKIQEFARKYGKIYSMYLGRHLVVIMNDFEIIHEAFVKKADTFSSRPDGFPFRVFPHLNGIVTSEGAEFKVYKSFIVSALKDAGALKSSLETIVLDNAQHFLQTLERTAGKPVNILEDLGLSVAQTYNRLFFGRTVSYESDWFRRLIKLNYDQQRLYGNGPRIYLDRWMTSLPFVSSIWGDREIKQVTTEIMDILDQQVKELEDNYTEGSRNNFVHCWITEQTNRKKINSKEDLFNRDNMIHNVNVVYGAGYETTTSTIRWILILLMERPEVQQRLQQEVDDVIGDERSPSMADELRMPHTQSFIMEIHRYTTNGPLGVQHRNKEDSELGGYFIPRNSYIISNQLRVHMDPKIFHQPKTFKPDRFIQADGKYKRPQEVLAFSIGRRACPGEPLAQCEIFLYLTNILQKFTVVNPEDQVLPNPFSSVRSGSLSSEPDEFRVIFVPRTK